MLTNYLELEQDELIRIVSEGLKSLHLEGKRILLIIPDSTRTAPIGQLFKMIFNCLRGRAARLDVMIALGTHPPMDEPAICRRLEITLQERESTYREVAFLNHRWNEFDSLTKIGTLSSDEIEQLSEGAFRLDVNVTINSSIFQYDQLLILGPVFPHEVAGFSGGAKYLFPGISGPELLNFFHWLGAKVTNYRIIGEKYTPVREVIHRAARMISVPCHAFCAVVREGRAVHLSFGTPEEAWSSSADLSAQVHVTHTGREFSTVLSCAPPMYEDLWVGGKCMYKLESVVASGGELIIYAPHIREISPTHGKDIERLGYHVFDFFSKQWDTYEAEPWGVLAHLTHVKGLGAYFDGMETPRINVTLATGICEEMCQKINLGFKDPASIDPSKFEGKESEGILCVRNAGEILYRV